MTLELALLLPMVALLLVAVLELVGLSRDLLVVQDLARQAARVAATTSDHGTVVAVVTGRLPSADVQVAPRSRRVGTQVRVTVRFEVVVAGRGLSLTGSGVAMVEPGVS